MLLIPKLISFLIHEHQFTLFLWSYGAIDTKTYKFSALSPSIHLVCGGLRCYRQLVRCRNDGDGSGADAGLYMHRRLPTVGMT